MGTNEFVPKDDIEIFTRNVCYLFLFFFFCFTFLLVGAAKATETVSGTTCLKKFIVRHVAIGSRKYQNSNAESMRKAGGVIRGGC